MKHETYKHLAVFAWNERDELPDVATSDGAGAAVVIGRWLTSSTTPTPPNAVPALRLPLHWSAVNYWGVSPEVPSGDVSVLRAGVRSMTRAQALNLVAWLAHVARLSAAEIALARVAIEALP